MSSIIDMRPTPEGIVMLFIIFGTWSLFFYKENQWFRLVQAIYGASVSAMVTVSGYSSFVKNGINPLLGGNYIMLIAVVLGFMMFFKFYRPLDFLARIPVSISVGVGTGLALRTYLNSMVFRQLISTVNLGNLSTLKGFFGTGTGYALNNALFIIIFVAALTYFVFSEPFTRFKGVSWLQKFGRYAIMVGLGLAWGSMVSSRLNQGLSLMIFLLTGQYIPS